MHEHIYSQHAPYHPAGQCTGRYQQGWENILRGRFYLATPTGVPQRAGSDSVWRSGPGWEEATLIQCGPNGPSKHRLNGDPAEKSEGDSIWKLTEI